MKAEGFYGGKEIERFNATEFGIFFLNFENINFFFFFNKILISNFIKINILINKLKKKRSKEVETEGLFLGL